MSSRISRIATAPGLNSAADYSDRARARHAPRSIIALAAVACACGPDPGALTSQDEGEYSSDELDLRARFRPGALRSATGEGASWRGAAGVGSLLAQTGPRASGEAWLTVRNVHPRALAVVTRRASSAPSCQGLGPPTISCALEPDAAPCAGIRWEAPSRTARRARLELEACAQWDLRLAIEPGAPPTSAIAVGSPGSIARLEGALRARRLEPDALIVLGDLLDPSRDEVSASIARLEAIERYAVILIPGEAEREALPGGGFARQFGALPYRFSWGSAQYIALDTSAERSASAREAARAGQLRAMRDEASAWLERGLVSEREIVARALSYRPPLDPRAFAQRGERSPFVGAGLLAQLARYGVSRVLSSGRGERGASAGPPRIDVLSMSAPGDDRAQLLELDR